MAREHRERELKFDIPGDFEPPDLVAAVGALAPDATLDTTTLKLEATYYDTDDRHLQRAGITLRRRRGGDDDGWHLKLPGDDARLEIQVQSRSSTPPREISELVQGIRLGQPIRQRLKLQTHREQHRLVAGGDCVAEIALDDVTSIVVGDEPLVDVWRELEVELCAAGDEQLLGKLAKQMKKAGAVRSAHVSKYSRGIGPAARRARLKGLPALVDDYLEEQRNALAHGDLRMRREENAVHRTRVAIRRTRSTLRVFGDLFDPERTAVLDAELKWYAEVLGRVRDLDIIRDGLVARVDELPDAPGQETLHAHAVAWLDSERAGAWKAVQAALRGRRYKALLVELDHWRVDPPWTALAAQKKGAVASYVAAAAKKAAKRLRKATKKAGESREHHSARKAVKRWRYALELAEPQLGARAKKRVTYLKQMQNDLGAVQDAVMSADELRRMATSADSRGRTAFAYGLLYARVEQTGELARRRVRRRYG
jgi:CHAD domain-containing protein